MRPGLLLFVFLFAVVNAFSQSAYVSAIDSFRTNYILHHEVVKPVDRKYFRFFKPDHKYLVKAKFERIIDTIGFRMPTSGKKTPLYFRYGMLHFSIKGKNMKLTVYQGKDTRESEEYKDHLFVPFTDLTSGEQSYGGGRYIDLLIQDIKDNSVILDFNKAYNPYCAYALGYNCPIPPRENDLSIAIKAGEKAFDKH